MKTIGSGQININKPYNNKEWFTEELTLLAEEKRNAYIKYQNNRTQEESNIHGKVRNRTMGSIRQLKMEYREKFFKDMESDLNRGKKKVWKMLRKGKEPINKEVDDNNVTAEM